MKQEAPTSNRKVKWGRLHNRRSCRKGKEV